MDEQQSANSSSNKNIIIAVIAVVVILVVAAGGFMFLKSKAENAPAQVEGAEDSAAREASPVPTASIKKSPQTYKDGNYSAV